MLVTDEATGIEAARLTRNAALGELVEPLAPGPAGLWDKANALTVRLYSGHLASVDDGVALAGGNRLAVETDSGAWEVVGFATAELLSPGTYRLSRLLRGQLATGHAIGPAAGGNRIAVLDGRPLLASVLPHWLGETLALRAFAGPSDGIGASLAVHVDLAPVLPLAPVHLRACRAPGSDDVMLSWVRCSRADADSWAAADAPHDHLPEAYRVSILDGASAVREITTNVPSASYSGAEQTADFGAPPPGFGFTVVQMSPVYGPGHSATGAFNA